MFKNEGFCDSWLEGDLLVVVKKKKFKGVIGIMVRWMDVIE
jgi:hypothetical protein